MHDSTYNFTVKNGPPHLSQEDINKIVAAFAKEARAEGYWEGYADGFEAGQEICDD